MTYNSFLDFFFSAGWFSFGFVVLFFIFFGIFRKPLYVNRKRKKLIAFLLFAIPIIWLMMYGLFNPKFFGYGQPIEIISLRFMNGKLFITGYILTAGGKSCRGEACYRMHTLDPLTGGKSLTWP